MGKSQQQVVGQQSMLENNGRRRGFFWVKGSKANKKKSTPEKTVFTTPNGKEFEVETDYGKSKRFKQEIKSGKHSVTGQTLSAEDVAYRKGVVNTMSAQARKWKRQHNQ